MNACRRMRLDAVDPITAAQSEDGGWNYAPDGGGDEGSVAVPQMQALRACRDGGIAVPKETVDRAVASIARSTNPDGGIRCRAATNGPSRPAITAAGWRPYTRLRNTTTHGRGRGATCPPTGGNLLSGMWAGSR